MGMIAVFLVFCFLDDVHKMNSQASFPSGDWEYKQLTLFFFCGCMESHAQTVWDSKILRTKENLPIQDNMYFKYQSRGIRALRSGMFN